MNLEPIKPRAIPHHLPTAPEPGDIVEIVSEEARPIVSVSAPSQPSANQPAATSKKPNRSRPFKPIQRKAANVCQTALKENGVLVSRPMVSLINSELDLQKQDFPLPVPTLNLKEKKNNLESKENKCTDHQPRTAVRPEIVETVTSPRQGLQTTKPSAVSGKTVETSARPMGHVSRQVDLQHPIAIHPRGQLPILPSTLRKMQNFFFYI